MTQINWPEPMPAMGENRVQSCTVLPQNATYEDKDFHLHPQ